MRVFESCAIEVCLMPYAILNLDSLPHAFVVFDTMLLNIVHTFQLAIVRLLLKISVCGGSKF